MFITSILKILHLKYNLGYSYSSVLYFNCMYTFTVDCFQFECEAEVCCWIIITE